MRGEKQAKEDDIKHMSQHCTVATNFGLHAAARGK
jgi:hypothetical protein